MTIKDILRHDIPDREGKKNQRGWKGVRLQAENSSQYQEIVSEPSDRLIPDASGGYFPPLTENPPGISDASDKFF